MGRHFTGEGGARRMGPPVAGAVATLFPSMGESRKALARRRSSQVAGVSQEGGESAPDDVDNGPARGCEDRPDGSRMASVAEREEEKRRRRYFGLTMRAAARACGGGLFGGFPSPAPPPPGGPKSTKSNSTGGMQFATGEAMRGIVEPLAALA